MPARLTKAQKAELGPEAVAMSARGKPYTEIAEALGVNWKTVAKLIDDELAARAEHRANDVERHLANYDQAQIEAWRLYRNCPDDRAQNKASALGLVIQAENSKVKLTGAEAAQKRDINVNDQREPSPTEREANELDEEIAELTRAGASAAEEGEG